METVGAFAARAGTDPSFAGAPHHHIEAARKVYEEVLASWGVPPAEHIIVDGSGLSRQNLVTPHAIVQLLRYASAQPWGAAFKNTLPVSGTDGSLSERLNSSRMQGRIFGKTGSLGGVKTLSGYATTDSGDYVAFSILSNNFNLPGKRVTDTIDQIVQAIVEDGPETK